jgi:outer membrane protein
LILTYPQRHDVSLNGTKIGTAKHLPPTLTVQYHFFPDGKFRPYLGAGINYTHFSDVNLNVPGVGQLDLGRSSWGGALQAGIDVEIGKNKFINFDVKKIYIGTDVKLAATGATVSHVRLDPVVLGVGFGWRF